MQVVHAYRYALDPTPRQERLLRSHCGAARLAFNWGLARVKANLAQREAERSYDIPDAQLTPPLSWSMFSLRKAWNGAKQEVAPWWAENSKESYACGLDRLATALTNWSESRKGTRKGPKMGFPRFRSKRNQAAGPRDLRRRVRRNPPPVSLQDRVGWRPAAGSPPARRVPGAAR